jgi:hypothetical protein
MSLVVYLVSAIAGLYALMWLVFTFTDPPSALFYYFRAPAWLSFLPGERAAASMGASYLVSMFAF